jgi:hypothetical protein
MTIKTAFAERFGQDQACAIQAAAEEHENGINSANKGDDPFKWALLTAIGYECMSKDSYREYHGISAPWDEVRQWMKDHADLGSHNGDSDYLSLLCGAYSEFMPGDVA